MHITNSLTHLEEFFVLFNGLLVLSEVVVEDSGRVVCTTFITGFAGSLACKSENIVILEPLLSGDTIIRIGVGHIETTVVLQNTCGQLLSLVSEALLRDDIFLALRGIEIDGKLNALWLINSQREI